MPQQHQRKGDADDTDGQCITRSRHLGQPGGFITASIGALYEEDTPSGATRTLYRFAGRVVAQRAVAGGVPTVTYLHGDHLGSVSATSSAGGALTAQQLYAPYGAIRLTNGLATTLAFTGQRQDGTGLLYYGARYYDPALGRFVSPDSLVPGAASGAGGGAATLGQDERGALRPLTVDFREPGFAAGVAAENRVTQKRATGSSCAAWTDERRRWAGGRRTRRRATATAMCSTTCCGISTRMGTRRWRSSWPGWGSRP